MRLKLTNSLPLKLASLLVCCVAACATVQVPQDLVDARSAYRRAQQAQAQMNGSASAQIPPEAMQAAKVALDKAEASFLDNPNAQETRDLASVARKKAQLANGI
jgi:hypothetical protein